MIERLPHWCMTHSHPAFNDLESKTAIEMVARVYGKTNELVDDYNKYVDNINKEIENFETGITSDFECFKENITKIVHDYITMIDEKIKVQDDVIADAVDYMKTNLAITIGELLENGELNHDIVRALSDVEGELLTRQTEFENEVNNELLTQQARIDNVTQLQEGSTTGDAELTDIRVAYNGKTYDTAGNSVRGQINTLREKYKDETLSLNAGFIKKPHGLNLFNMYSDEIVTGWLDDSGNLNSSSSGRTSNYIEVEVGKTYSYLTWLNFYGSNKAHKLCAYDENKNYVGNIFGVVDAETHVNVITCSETTSTGNAYKYVRFSYNVADAKNVMFVEGEYPTEPITYHLDERIQVPANNPLKSKTLYVIGDSICNGAGFAGGYGGIIASENEMNLVNRGHDGGTLANTGSERYCITSNLGYNPPECDYVIVEGGVNDISINTPVGAITDGYEATLDTSTFCGALENICKTLCTTYATKKVGFLFPHRMNGETGYNTYHPLIKQICEKWGVPYLDLSTLVPPLNFVESLKTDYTANGDGWHPNEAGYKLFYTPKIVNWMKSL